MIFSRGGMLDKYMGDGLMAIFGAPVMGSADADNALCVATDMVRALGIFNNWRGEHGFEPIEIGIGLATGEVLAGSVGATKRMEDTAIGGNVNLAARLESAKIFWYVRAAGREYGRLRRAFEGVDRALGQQHERAKKFVGAFESRREVHIAADGGVLNPLGRPDRTGKYLSGG